MIQRKFKIKDDVLLETTEVRIVDRTKLFKYNPKKALELFAEDIGKAKVVKNPALGNHSIFYYMFGHMNDWIRYAEKEVICAKAMLTQAYRLEETIQILKLSPSYKEAVEKLMETLGQDENGARYVADQRLSVITGIIPDVQKEYIEELEKRLSNVKELATYDR